jgi:CHAD domain-containing protein/uncharacterized protein YjbK
MGSYREIERKFDADSDVALPDLRGVGDIATVTDPAEITLEATYFDTADMQLAIHRTTLRRRTGGTDEGWHLKLPADGDARTEVRLPLDSSLDTVPTELVKQVRALVRGRELVPVAVLRTTRRERQLLDATGNELAVLADDRVRAERLGEHSGTPSAWREVEVELVEGDQELLDAVSRLLVSTGLSRSAAASKLQRCLGDLVPEQRKHPTLTPRSPAGEVALAHLRQQIQELVSRDRGARVDEPDAVHKMRVATRRLRSALATFRPVFDRTRTDPVRDELRWLGGALGEPRDAEVMRERLRHLAREQPDELLLGPVLRRIGLEMDERHRTAHGHLLEALDDERYLRLLGALDQLLADPPFTAAARRRAKRELPRLVARACRRVDRAAHAVEVAGSREEHDRLLHEVRKSAKRARYAAESVAPVFGKPAIRLAKRMENLQEVLGEHQDSVVARDVLRSIGVVAHLSGENGFSFGLLHGIERCRGAAAQREYASALRAASKKKPRRWTR